MQDGVRDVADRASPGHVADLVEHACRPGVGEHATVMRRHAGEERVEQPARDAEAERALQIGRPGPCGATPSAPPRHGGEQARLADAGGALEHGDATASALRPDDQRGRTVEQAGAFQKLGASHTRNPKAASCHCLARTP